MCSTLFVIWTAFGVCAQEFTLTATAANTVSSKSSIDMPGLTGNPLAIIVATPVGNTAMLNPHPIGAWYYSGKWNIFNSDHAVMPLGAKYSVTFFQQPGPNQFLHIVTQQNLGSEGSYIDNAALNGNPGAVFKILQNHSPDVRTPYNLNRFEAQAAYSSAAGRWYIANVGGEPIGRGAAYNIVINSGGVATNPNLTGQPTTTNPTGQPTTTNSPVPTTPTGNPTNPNPPTPLPDQPRTPKTPGPVVTPTPLQTPTPAPLPTPTPLVGIVDMHTHPMSHLAFGKKLLHGAPDIGMIVPAGTRNCNPNDFRAASIVDALGNCNATHGGWGLNNRCGDHIRSFVVSGLFDDEFKHNLGNDPFNGGNLFGDHRHEGIEINPLEPNPGMFKYAPHQSSKVHQQMWWEWIKRAKEEGHLRVMVALTVNSELLAKILNGDSPQDDKASADLQIDEIKTFIGRHPDFMEIAYTPVDLRRIVGQNKLAVILGMEVDNIGNFNKPGVVVTEATVKTEILRLHGKGVRYVFPIHLVNNKFGGTAVYEDLFNFANKYSTGSFYKVVESDAVAYKLGKMSDIGVFMSTSKDLRPLLDGMYGVPYPPAFNADPGSPDFCMNPIPFNGSLGCWRTFRLLKGILNPPPEYQVYDTIPKGHVNDVGLSGIGKFAVKEMMKLGMLIDIDHMSDLSQADTFTIAEGFNYPVNMGHNGLQNQRVSERITTIDTVKRVAASGGVFGIGTADSDEHNYDAQTFISSFSEVWTAMGNNPAVAMGTDVNGMERLPRASQGITPNFYSSTFRKARTGTRIWDYTTEGVVHYGLMADFIRDVNIRNTTVFNNLMTSAEKFAQMWEKADKQKLCAQSGQPTC